MIAELFQSASSSDLSRSPTESPYDSLSWCFQMQKSLRLAMWFNFTLFCSLKTKRRKVVSFFLNNDRAVESYWFMTLSWNDCWGAGEGQHATSFVRTERVVKCVLRFEDRMGSFLLFFLFEYSVWATSCLIEILCMLHPVTPVFMRRGKGSIAFASCHILTAF